MSFYTVHGNKKNEIMMVCISGIAEDFRPLLSLPMHRNDYLWASIQPSDTTAQFRDPHCLHVMGYFLCIFLWFLPFLSSCMRRNSGIINWQVTYVTWKLGTEPINQLLIPSRNAILTSFPKASNWGRLKLIILRRISHKVTVFAFPTSWILIKFNFRYRSEVAAWRSGIVVGLDQQG